MHKTHVIIGSSAAAIGAINRLSRLRPDDEIVCITAQKELPYNTCFLVDHLAGKKSIEQVYMPTAQNKNIQFILETRLTAIAPNEKCVTLSDGQTIDYDTLLLGMGVSPFIPPLEGIDTLAGVFTFHTLTDVQRIQADMQEHQAKKVVVMGAGFTGLECADALLKLGLEVVVVDMAPHVLPHHLDSAGADFIESHMAICGVTLCVDDKVVGLLSSLRHTSDKSAEISAQGSRFAGVVLNSGEQVIADMFICAIGARPNSQVAAQAGIELYGNGIKTNDFMQTNYPDIYAAGDVAAVKDQLTGGLIQSCMWADAMLQGMTAAYGMAGEQKIYPGVVIISSSEFFGVPIAACGLKPGTPGFEVVVWHDFNGYQQFVFDAERRIKGFVLLGNLDRFAELKRALLTQEPIE